MIAKIVGIIAMSAVLNYVSQLKSTVTAGFCAGSQIIDCSNVSKKVSGFPFGYQQNIDGVGSINFGMFALNWLIWLAVAGIIMLILSKVLELFGKIALAVALILIVAVFFGIIKL